MGRGAVESIDRQPDRHRITAHTAAGSRTGGGIGYPPRYHLHHRRTSRDYSARWSCHACVCGRWVNPPPCRSCRSSLQRADGQSFGRAPRHLFGLRAQPREQPHALPPLPPQRLRYAAPLHRGRNRRANARQKLISPCPAQHKTTRRVDVGSHRIIATRIFYTRALSARKKVLSGLLSIASSDS